MYHHRRARLSVPGQEAVRVDNQPDKLQYPELATQPCGPASQDRMAAVLIEGARCRMGGAETSPVGVVEAQRAIARR